MGPTPRPSPLARIGAGGARHPFVVLGAWFVVLVVIFGTAILGLGGQSLFGRLANGVPSVQGESYRGQQLLTTGTQSTTYTLLVHNVNLDSPALAEIGRAHV